MLRALVLGVLLFWVVMTALLLRVVYFPEGSMFEKVPPSMVFKMFLEQQLSSSTWVLYRGEQKVGPVMISQVPVGRSRNTGRAEDDYMVKIQGTMEPGTFDQVVGRVVWRMNMLVEGMSDLRSVNGQVRIPDEDRVFSFEWKPGDAMPKFELKQQGMVVMDDQLVGPMVAQMMGSNQARLKEAAETKDQWLTLTAREGSMNFGGQRRQGYVVEAIATLMAQWKVKAFFTEVGELALVDLPEGYRVMEQLIHGLAPEYPDEEEEEPE
ncbi:hypothetical protein FEM03_23755 [Phragmitibacter flavus]|uniref:Uncharacterized protein n=1 Tax=Phragmitibacter flavus TaxID=2576071 RepID=A0A5R8K777_9BACT|nr:hypothetical protein [Phragmitibacter flavus]TLD68226.1 hypothetical protein FEM03_23755 [Phragmitibacter flavus]